MIPTALSFDRWRRPSPGCRHPCGMRDVGAKLEHPSTVSALRAETVEGCSSLAPPYVPGGAAPTVRIHGPWYDPISIHHALPQSKPAGRSSTLAPGSDEQRSPVEITRQACIGSTGGAQQVRLTFVFAA